MYMYFKETGGEKTYMGVYVDDIVLTAKTDEMLEQVKKDLAKQFDIKDIGYFLGMSIIQEDDCNPSGSVNQDIPRIY